MFNFYSKGLIFPRSLYSLRWLLNRNSSTSSLKNKSLIIAMFPGQGSQYIGMAERLVNEFPEAKRVVEEVEEACGRRLIDTMLDGPLDQLTATEVAQPAIYAHSMALYRALQVYTDFFERYETPVVLGHSVGEYSALAAAECISIYDGARVVNARAIAMASTAVDIPGGGVMEALLYTTVEQANEVVLAAQQLTNEVCCVANINSDIEIVISGTRRAVSAAVDYALSHKICKRSVSLNVSSAFHSSYMMPASDAVHQVLSTITLHPPRIPIIFNSTANIEYDIETIRHLLSSQMVQPVMWKKSMEHAVDFSGASTMIEMGPSNVLTNILRRCEGLRNLLVEKGLPTVKVLSAMAFLPTS